MVNCVNCNNEVSTSFCGNCGQPNPPKKLGFGNMWFDFQSRIYGFDGMFPRTLIDLTIRPGIVARDYIKGNRIKYYGPVGYFFLTITLFLLIMSMMNIDFTEFTKATTKEFGDVPQNEASKEIQRRIMSLMTDNMRIFSFLLVVPITLVSGLFFRKAGYNLLEHAVIPFYVFGHAYWLTILSLFYVKFGGENAGITLQLIISILYFAFAVANFYTHNSKVKAFAKGIAVYLIGYLLFGLIMMAFAYLYVLNDPEIIELMKKGTH